VAACANCGTKLGLLQRFRKPPLCDNCARELKATEVGAREKLSALLEQLGSGEGDPLLLLPVLAESAERSGLSARDLAEMKTGAFRRRALAALDDDILSEAEENQLLKLGQALGVDDQELQTSQKDILHRLIVARVNDGRLPSLAEPMLLRKKGEIVHAEMNATLMKEITLREYRGGYSGFSFRVMKGVRYHVGGTRGHSVVVGSELQTADAGVLSLSSRRAVFLGSNSTIEIPYAKLVNLSVFTDGVRFHVSNRKTAPLFKLDSGDVAAAVINAAVQRLEG
jgi:hypothetical protein